jgi:hypothetical protein
MPDMSFRHVGRKRGQERNPAKMIFGFNTDIKAENTVYHVQTEVREQERRLESQVFVSGRCIGKRSAALPEGTAVEEIQELARAQHRWVVDAVREGFVDEVLNPEVGEALAVQFLGSQRVSDEAVILSFRVLSGGFIAADAQVEARWKTDSASGVLKSAITDDAGVAKMRLALAGGAAELEIRVLLEGREAVRRFIVKSAKS